MSPLFDPTNINSWLSFDEGRKLKQYLDSLGNPSIGIGFLISGGLCGVVPSDRDLINIGITDQECDSIFEKKISGIMGCVRCKLNWFDNLDIVRQNVLLNIAFNEGCDGLFGYIHMLAYASQGMWAPAAAEILDSKAFKKEHLVARYQRLHDAMLNGGLS